jgi:hypothetical protein
MKKILSMLLICLLVITIQGRSVNGNLTPNQDTKVNNAANNLKPQVNQVGKTDISKYKFAIYLVKNLFRYILAIIFFIDSTREGTPS